MSSIYLPFDAQSKAGCFSEDLPALGTIFSAVFMWPSFLVGILSSLASDIAFTVAFAASIAACEPTSVFSYLCLWFAFHIITCFFSVIFYFWHHVVLFSLCLITLVVISDYLLCVNVTDYIWSLCAWIWICLHDILQNMYTQHKHVGMSSLALYTQSLS